MSVLKIFRGKDVPQELPQLAIDDIKEKIKEVEKQKSETALNGSLETIKKPEKIIKEYLRQDNDKMAEKGEEKSKVISEKKKVEDLVEEREETISEEKSFFNGLLKDMNGEMKDLKKLGNLYNGKLSSDLVGDMKEYWEKNKGGIVLKNLGRDFKEKIGEKIIELQNLEKEWQNAYFSLIEKEEKIRDRERELKKIIAEFTELCKKRIKPGKKKKH
jgi:hypothetical protein